MVILLLDPAEWRFGLVEAREEAERLRALGYRVRLVRPAESEPPEEEAP